MAQIVYVIQSEGDGDVLGVITSDNVKNFVTHVESMLKRVYETDEVQIISARSGSLIKVVAKAQNRKETYILSPMKLNELTQ